MDLFTTPLLTARETACHLQLPLSTLNGWLAEGRGSPALVHEVAPAPGDPRVRGWPRVPFVGVVEAYVLRSLRDLGLSKATIRAAATQVRAEFGTRHALASRRIASDGVEIFVRYCDGLATVRGQQRPIRTVVDDHLRFIAWNDDGWPRRLRLRQYGTAAPVVIDPRFGWGEPVLEATKTPVAAVLVLRRAGEPAEVVAAEFGLTRDTVDQICRAAPAA
ncbi:MAG: DUF433 domain-containing protein [Nocardioidaceae bacterium]|nr:DUF433 domain-containing protein [Nocardioidaceae bacterium]